MHLSVRDIDTSRCRDMALRSRKEFFRNVRSFGVPRAQSAHITKAKGFPYHDFEEVYITRDEVALYHDGNAVHITPR